MPHKVGALQCPCPIHPAVLAAQWCGPLGRDCGGSVQDVSSPSPMNTSSWECGIPGFGYPWLCSAPSLATRMGDGGCVVAGKEVGRSSCCGAGQTPIFLTQGPRAGLGRVLVLGLVLALRTTCTSVCSCCAPWICPPKAVWGDASVLLPAQTFPPLLGRDGTSPGNLHNSWVAGEGQP